MSDSITKTTPVDPLTLLNEKEAEAYRIYMRLKQPPMAQSAQESLFQLFLVGQSCEDIVRLHKTGFSLGAVVRARIENGWDQKLWEHQQRLAEETKVNVQQAIYETANTIALEMQAYVKLKRDKILRYIETNDPKHIDDLNLASVKHLKDAAEALVKLTGQDGKKAPLTVNHQHTIQAGGAPKTIEGKDTSRKQLTPQQALAIFQALNPDPEPESGEE